MFKHCVYIFNMILKANTKTKNINPPQFVYCGIVSSADQHGFKL